MQPNLNLTELPDSSKFSSKIYRLSDDEREWIEVGEIPEIRIYFGVASLNGRIYITGGKKSLICMINSVSLYI